MSLVIESDPVPLKADTEGVIRVGETRVTLDTVITAYHLGATADEIADSYDTVPLADIHAVIGYYLRHRSEVDAYLAEREKDAAVLRREIEARFPPKGIRERLLARRTSKK